MRFVFTLTLLLLSTPISYGQTTVWLSDNATFSDLDITTASPPGTTGSFDIWIKTEHSNRYNGLDLDLMTMGDAIELTGADIVIGRNRFQIQGEPTVLNNGALISDIWVYAGIGGQDLGSGIGPGVPVDDTALDAYRFAIVHYRIAGAGTSDLQLKIGQLGFGNIAPNVVRLGIDDPISDGYIPGDTDSVIDGRVVVLPESGSVVLFLLGGWLLLMMRLRGQGISCRSNISEFDCTSMRKAKGTGIIFG